VRRLTENRSVWLLLPLLTLAFFLGATVGLVLEAAPAPCVPLAWWVACSGAAVATTSRRIAAGAIALAALATGLFVAAVPQDPGGRLPAGERELLVEVESLRPVSEEGQLLVRLLGHRVASADPWETDMRRFVVAHAPGIRAPVRGDVLYLRGSLEPPGRPLHDYAFDPRAWSRSRGIAGRIRPLTTVAWVRDGHGMASALDRVRIRVERSLLTRASSASSGVLVAIVTGSRGGIDAETRARFAANGAAHVLAVSGLHLGLLSVAVFAALRWLASWLTPLTARVPADRVAAWAVVPLVLAYVALTGAPASAVRAGAMTLTVLAMIIAGRRPSGVHALCFAAVLMVGSRPHWLADVGFQLSVSATLSLVLASRVARGAPRLPTRWVDRLVSSLRVSTVATIATAPVLLWHFGQVPLASPITNLLVVPPIALVALPAALLGALLDAAGLWGAAPLIAVADVAVRLALLVAEEGSHTLELPLTWGRPGAIALAGWCIAAATSPWFGVASLRAHVVAAAVVVALLFAGRPDAMRRGELRMHAIPVGQGDATLLELPEGTRILVDAGGVAFSTRSTADTSVLPYLRGLGVGRLDVVVVTHSDFDHAGGVPGVILATRPAEVWLPPEPDRAVLLRIREAAAHVGARVVSLRWPVARVRGGASVTAFAGVFSPNANDGSVVMRVCYGDVCFLLTGDIELEREAALAASGLDLRADVLKVPHHGSRTSSSDALLDLVRPRVALFHLGHENRFGFPRPDVVSRYRDRAIRIRRTDRGAVVVTTDGERIRLSR
jgi:competence protein ComEC